MIRDDIVAAARAMLGTPFQHQGRQPEAGLDCAGLVIAVCQRLDIAYLDAPAYGRRPHAGLLENHLAAQPCIESILIGQALPGDLLLMRFVAEPQHLAIHTDIGLIHACESAGAVVEHRMDHRWRRRIVAAWSFREVEA